MKVKEEVVGNRDSNIKSNQTLTLSSRNDGGSPAKAASWRPQERVLGRAFSPSWDSQVKEQIERGRQVRKHHPVQVTGKAMQKLGLLCLTESVVHKVSSLQMSFWLLIPTQAFSYCGIGNNNFWWIWFASRCSQGSNIFNTFHCSPSSSSQSQEVPPRTRSFEDVGDKYPWVWVWDHPVQRLAPPPSQRST